MSRGASWIVAFAILVALVGAYLWYSSAYPTTTTGAPSSSTTTATKTASTPNAPAPTEGCSGCLGVDDNGKTLALAETSRLTLLLPSATYDNTALTVTPSGALGETFGASAPVGMWVRTFEATTPGTAKIFVPAKTANAEPFAITVITVDQAHAWESGFLIVGKSAANQTVNLALHERFIIELGNDLNWSLKFSPSGSITRVANSASTGGIQGVYEAQQAGKAFLQATGAPICKPGEACPQFLLNVTVNFVIQ